MTVTINHLAIVARRLEAIEPKLKRKAFRVAFRKSAKRLKDRLIVNASGRILRVKSGTFLSALRSAPIRSRSRDRNEIRIGLLLPSREKLQIEGDDRHYYPAALEYGGSNGSPRPFRLFRRTVDEIGPDEIYQIARETEQAIARFAGKG